MTWDSFMYGVGIGCLISIASIAAAIFAENLVRQWPRIIRTLRGNDEPGFVPLSPTASVPPLRTRPSPLRGVEADAQLTRDVAA